MEDVFAAISAELVVMPVVFAAIFDALVEIPAVLVETPAAFVATPAAFVAMPVVFVAIFVAFVFMFVALVFIFVVFVVIWAELFATFVVFALTDACNAPPSLARFPFASVVTTPWIAPCAASDPADGRPGAVIVSLTVPRTIWLLRVVAALAPIAVEARCAAMDRSPRAVEKLPKA